MLSQTAEYALRAVLWLASQGGEARTTRQIAAGTQVPAGYLAKILQRMVRHEYVTSRRGPSGGFRLNKPPGEITALEIVEMVEPLHHIDECPLGLPAHEHELCALHRELDNAFRAFEKALKRATIEELLADPRESGGRAPEGGAGPPD